MQVRKCNILKPRPAMNTLPRLHRWEPKSVKKHYEKSVLPYRRSADLFNLGVSPSLSLCFKVCSLFFGIKFCAAVLEKNLSGSKMEFEV